MSCLICFLDDDFQSRLRDTAQNKFERFETSLTDYKKAFLAEFDFLQPLNSCPVHNNVESRTKEWVNELWKALGSLKDIGDVFDEVSSVYKWWVSGDTQKAGGELERLFRSKNLLQESKVFDNYILFRGRPSRQVLGIQDLYHIPFNNRYLIGNQRYSISGQPLLYLGLSVVDVVAELKLPFDQIEEVYFSSFMLPENHALKVLPFTNEFPLLITIIDELYKSDTKYKFDDPGYSPNRADCVRGFYKLILSSVCSFKRRQESVANHFCEEYVLPQLLSEVIRRLGLDGIVSSSTRITRAQCFSTDTVRVNTYRENLALFTKYHEMDNYDNALLSSMRISKPVRYSDCLPVSQEQIGDLVSQIVSLNDTVPKINSIGALVQFSGVTTKRLVEQLKIINPDGSQHDYSVHPIGKMHFYLLYQMLTEIRNQWM